MFSDQGSIFFYIFFHAILNSMSDLKYNVISLNEELQNTSQTTNNFFTGWSLADYNYEKTGLELCNEEQQKAIIWLLRPNEKYFSMFASNNRSSSTKFLIRNGAYSKRIVNDKLGFICIK